MKVQNYQDHSNISTIIDQRLGNRFTAEGMEEFIQLIIRCVDTSSERRPSMSYVLMELDRILEKETTLTTLVGEGIPNVILGSQLFKASKWKEWGFGLFASNCWVWSLWNTFYFLIFSLFKKRKKEKKKTLKEIQLFDKCIKNSCIIFWFFSAINVWEYCCKPLFVHIIMKVGFSVILVISVNGCFNFYKYQLLSRIKCIYFIWIFFVRLSVTTKCH